MVKKLLNQNYYLSEATEDVEKKFFVSYRKSYDKIKKERRFSFDDRMKIVIESQGLGASIEDICSRESISITKFKLWTEEFLSVKDSENRSKNLFQDNTLDTDKFKFVIEGKTGETSVAEICRRENISHDTFLEWSSKFLNLRNEELRKINDPNNSIYSFNKQFLSKRSNVDVFNYAENYINFSSGNTLLTAKADSPRLHNGSQFENVVNLQRINDIRFVNKYFEKVNSRLVNGGVFIGCLETLAARKKRKKINSIPLLNNIYFAGEFVIKRILPKVSFTKKHYFDITNGNDRLISKAEGLGRLVSCGFRIMDFKSIGGLVYFVVKKVSEPKFDLNPSYGPIYKMPRLGKNGKIIGVYKFRTMHPYSEYLQDYIVKAHGYANTGKPANDFRIPKWGKFMRRLWLDELPQLINVAKGELKLVGVRPVSQRYFEDIPTEMQKLRLTQIPGCIPPYVALNRAGNVMSVLTSEKEYLIEKIGNPYTTDLKYFFKALFNIIIRHKRSA